MSMFMAEVATLIREVAAREIMPRWRMLSAHEIEEKSKDDLVTVADREAELWLTPRLKEILPGSNVVGEEAVSADENVMSCLFSDEPLWTVDPVDGTANFVDGNDVFGVMISLVVKNAVRQAWIYLPVQDELFMAEEGSGAFLSKDGKECRLHAGKSAANPAEQRGSIYIRFMPDDWRDAIERYAEQIGERSSLFCSAWDYTNIARGRSDFVTYHRMFPWDHAPGSLILKEAGGVLRNLETDADYLPRTLKGPHLAARSEESWQQIAEQIRSAGR